MLHAVIILAAFAVSYLLTGWIRAFALRRGMLDIPNHRSSHTAPTPRGGGLGFAIPVFAGLLAMPLIWPQRQTLWLALLVGGLMVAGIGWLDDQRGLPASIRFVVHGLAAALALAALGGLSEVTLGSWRLHLGPFGSVLAWIGIVWAINLYNFMDGIDGLAAGEALTVALAGAGLLVLGGDGELAAFCLLLAAAAGGFLIWNWSPARIFMGDVGSGLLGFLFATVALTGERVGSVPLVLWVLLLAVFIVDATATLLRRMLAGEKWLAPHRSHAYQRLTQAGYTHRQVAGGVMLVNAVLAAAAYPGLFKPELVGPLLLVVMSFMWWAWWKITVRYPVRPSVSSIDCEKVTS